MSSYQVTEKLEEAIASGKYDLIVCNYANPDMVGHTGVMDAAVKAVDAIDECLGRLTRALENAGGLMLLTADHGNIEMMRDPTTHEPHTAHTTLDVPIIAFGAPKDAQLENGRLADVAPTMLDLMGLSKPALMTGHSLLVKGAWKRKTGISCRCRWPPGRLRQTSDLQSRGCRCSASPPRPTVPQTQEPRSI
jgi:2,3-bisphosphoglycerate-independent phosphoglycerate mutase